MNWQALKKYKCPKCNRNLFENKGASGHECVCGFFITKGKFDEIVNSVYKPRQFSSRSDEQNLSDLNNLGHREQSEGFEDSPHLDY